MSNVLIAANVALDYFWALPRANLTLSRAEIHVWRASLDLPASYSRSLAQTLSADERRKAELFYFEQDRKRFIVGRGLLRMILGHYLGIEPSRLQFYYESGGKPMLHETSNMSGLRFNLSHSHGLALYAVTRDREIGIDLEYVRPIPEAEQIAAWVFSPREYAVFRALPPSKKQEAFFKCWTRKEAYVKARGDGLARSLNRIEVSLAPGELMRPLSIEGDPQDASSWSLRDLTPASSYMAALAAEGHGWRLCCWQFPEQL